jgi:hypothetical protein
LLIPAEKAGELAPDSSAAASIAGIRIVDGRRGDIQPFPHETEPAGNIGRLSGGAMAKGVSPQN